MKLKTSKNIMLLSIIVFAFTYRFLLVTCNTFPPGTDIGLHESVIKSITSETPTNFFWNYYHMGSGASITNPGYHIFVATLEMMTSAPDFLLQGLVASVFSVLTVAVAFLIVRSLWNESAAFIVAILAAFSAGDIFILCWSGYPNIITLMLIPTVFYLYFQRQKFSKNVFFVTTIVLISSIFLTHVFSALIFTTITITAICLAAVIKRQELSKNQLAGWLAPIGLGVALVSPYLLGVAQLYVGPESGILGGISEIKDAIMGTRLVPLEVVAFSLVSIPMLFAASRLNGKKFLSLPTCLLLAWIIIPAVLTQSYLFGAYLDYERFLYFLFVPIIICAGLLIEAGAKRLSAKISIKPKAYWILVLGFIVLSLLFVPVFALPNLGYQNATYYQVMNQAGYDGLKWIRNETPQDSVFVADANYGWWLSGFAQRRTLSADEPENLMIARELEPASVARNILDTSYSIDNGIIRLQYDGPYGTGTPEFLIHLNQNMVPYQTFQLIENETLIQCKTNEAYKNYSLTDIPTVNVQIEKGSDYAAITINRQNELFKVNETITVFEGSNFTKVTVTLQGNYSEVNFDQIDFPFLTKGLLIQEKTTVAVADASTQVIGQIIFNQNQSDPEASLKNNPKYLNVNFNLQGESTVQTEFYVGIYQYEAALSKQQPNFLQEIVKNSTETFHDKNAQCEPIEVFSYQETITKWNIAYIVIREAESVPRFAKDPLFTLAFRNDELAIFQVL